MRITNKVRNELIARVMAKTPKEEERKLLLERITKDASEQFERVGKEKFPEFLKAIDSLPKIIVEELRCEHSISYALMGEQELLNALIALRGEDIPYTWFSVKLNKKFYIPKFFSTPNFKFPAALQKSIILWFNTYTDAEAELSTILLQCKTDSQLKDALPAVAALLPKEPKAGLPAIIPDAAVKKLAALGFPPKTPKLKSVKGA